MSLFSFLSKIWQGIKHLFDSIPEDLKAAVHVGVVVAENIKKLADSEAADVLTAIIPGNIDDKIKDWLRGTIPTILTELKLADSCGHLTDPAEITSCAIKVLQGLDANIQNAFLHNISVIVAQVASDNRLSWSDGVYLLEWYYQHQYKSTPSDAPAV